jgi:hypothetical protein
VADRNSAKECAVLDIVSKEITAYSLPAKESVLELLSLEEKGMHRGYQYLFSFFIEARGSDE